MQNIDIYKVIEDKSPKLARRVPGFILNYLRKILHEEEINYILTNYSGLQGVEFIRASLNYMGIKYHSVGMDKLDPEGRYIFASNHPFGGMDGLMLADEVYRKFGDVKVVVNDILMHIEPLKDMFVPVNKHGRQNSANVNAFNDAFASDVPIITFPAGLCSRRIKGEVCDLPWKVNFIKKAIASERQVVPVFFDGVLSNFFYRMYSVRKFLGIKTNPEMLYLVNEMFKQKGSNFEITIGDPIDYRELEKCATARAAAERVRAEVYALGGSAKQACV